MSSYNIAQNSSFEYDRDPNGWPDGWPKYSPQNESKIIYKESSSEVQAYNGNHMIEISDVTGISVVSTYNSEPIKDNKTYTASAVIKTDNVTGSGAILKFNILDSQGNDLAEKAIEKPIIGTKDWRRVVLTISEEEAKTLNENAAKLTVSVGTEGATNGTMYFDSVRFNEGNLKTEYVYDDNGNLKQIDNDDGSGYYNTSIIKDYNELGLVKSIKDGAWQETTFEYDKNANFTDINYPNGKGINHSYDTSDRLTDISYTSSGTDWHFDYDKNGNVTKVFKDGLQTILNQYDELNRIDVKNFYQAGESVDYDYNRSGQVIKIENSRIQILI
ncbi:MAG: RHS repeat protein [Firmicutes bacterium]|nr:RHS repeat protein [Bacillota bacterium]